MKSVKKHLSGILLVSITIASVLASTTPKNTFNKNENGWLPADLRPQAGVLLIEESAPKAQQKKIDQYMKENYPYKYEFVKADHLADTASKYKDKSIYRFALVNSWSGHMMHANTSNPLPINTADYNFIDLRTGKVYPKTGIPSSWASMTFKEVIKKVLKANP